MLHYSRWKTIAIWLTVLVGVIVAIPNLFSDEQLEHFPSFLPAKKVSLGLDLQGGSYIMLKLERDDVVRERLERTVAAIGSALRDAGISYTGLSGVGQRIQVRIGDPARIDAASAALGELANAVDQAGTVQDIVVEDGGNGLLMVRLTDEGIAYHAAAALGRSMEVVRLRVEQLGAAEPLIQRRGDDRIVVQVPGLQDPQRLKLLLDQTAKLTVHLVDTSMTVADAINDVPPASSEILYTIDDPVVPYLVRRQSLVSGDDLADVQAGFDPETYDPVVTFRYGSADTLRLAEATQQNAGGTMVTALDGQVIAVSPIEAPILDGAGRIDGNFTVEGANDLAMLLRAGPLPATLTVIEERTVGPGVGQDSINAGVVASIVSAIAVIAFMVGFYGVFGVMAIVALAFNVIMVLAVLSLVGSTLTLPGIAGIVLTMGMAVDSNVLVYERIRDEMKSGHSLAAAIDTGFRKAFSAIVDANLTTLIAAAVLFFLGSGAVRGFAVTLSIGIVTTVFTAFTMTRWLMVAWFNRQRPTHLPKGVRTGVFDGRHIPFMAVRRYTFAIAGALSIASLVGFTTLGLNLGIDFNGGSIIEAKARQGNADITGLRERLNDFNLGEIQVQEFGDPSSVLIRAQTQEAGENAEQSALSAIRSQIEDEYEVRRVEVVGPSVSGELTRTATLGVALALLGIVIYIWVRFEWQFAVGAIIAILHDVILTIGLFVFLGFDFNLTSIAAILTIIGYSLNDTVVVYDRMRDNLRRYPKMPVPLLIDASINQTLSRTVLTGSTTMLALAALYFFGGEIISSFALALLFGIVVGTFSSIYIAAPVLIAFRLRPRIAGGDGGGAPVVARTGA